MPAADGFVMPVPPYAAPREEVAMMLPCAFVVRRALGTVVMARLVVVAAPPVKVVYVVRPVALTLKSVDVEKAAVEEPIIKRFALYVSVARACTESLAKGEVVPSPTLPARYAVVVFGSNQYSAVVVAVEPIATTSDELFG
jgi:hypothetical protein